MSDELIKRIITVTNAAMKEGVAKTGNKWRKIDLVDDKNNKYSFFLDKKDGTETKAYLQWKEQGVSLGSQIGICFKEEPVEFTNKKGELVKMTRRSIAFLAEPSQIEDFNTVENTSNEAPAPEEPPTGDLPF